MSRLLLVLLLVLGVSCNAIAPFDPDDQPVRPPAIDDTDDAGLDGSDASDDAGLDCVPSCEKRACGPDGCGGLCAPGCGSGEVCIACPPLGVCEQEYWCAAPAPEQWVFIRAGDSFWMGSPDEELGRRDNEQRREVTLSHDFIIYSSEITQALAAGVLARNPSFFSPEGDGGDCGSDCPVEQLSWTMAAQIANYLTGDLRIEACYSPCTTDEECQLSAEYETPYDCPGFRLPTEAEWEYAARAGSLTATPVGDYSSADLGCSAAGHPLDGVAWFCGNSGATTHPVGTTRPNEWGLFDMLGNVLEWCHDYYDDDLSTAATVDPWGPHEGSRRAFRGGFWNDPAEDVRTAARGGAFPAERAFIGLRPVRTVNQPSFAIH